MNSDPYKPSQQIAVFCDWAHWVSQQFVVRLAAELEKGHESQSLVAVCVPQKLPYRRLLYRYFIDRIKSHLRALLYLDAAVNEKIPKPINLEALARRHGFIVLSACKLDTDDPAFLDRLDQLVNANVVLSIFWKSKFSPAFIRHFEQAVNYHNGSVPGYRGLLATAWSLYKREPQSGFTFHRISEQLDLGNVLIAGAIPIAANHTRFELEIEKTRVATECIEALLQKIAQNDPGEPQSRRNEYNHLSAARKLIHPETLDGLSGVEIRRRIRAFGLVTIPWAGGRLEVKRIYPVSEGTRLAGFREVSLQDGRWRVAWFDWLRWRLRSQ